MDTSQVQTLRPCVAQVDERNAVDQQAQLLAFDRQNHMGASDRLANNLQLAIAEQADAQMQDKRVVNSAVNIAENKHKMKVCFDSPPVTLRYSVKPTGMGLHSTTTKAFAYRSNLESCKSCSALLTRSLQWWIIMLQWESIMLMNHCS